MASSFPEDPAPEETKQCHCLEGEYPSMPPDVLSLQPACAEFMEKKAVQLNGDATADTSKHDQMKLMAQCMAQECEHSLLHKGYCRWATKADPYTHKTGWLCYGPKGQAFCEKNTRSNDCTDMQVAKGYDKSVGWVPLGKVAYWAHSSLSYDCTCVKHCSYQDGQATCTSDLIKVGADGTPADGITAAALGDALEDPASSDVWGKCACFCSSAEEDVDSSADAG